MFAEVECPAIRLIASTDNSYYTSNRTIIRHLFANRLWVCQPFKEPEATVKEESDPFSPYRNVRYAVRGIRSKVALKSFELAREHIQNAYSSISDNDNGSVIQFGKSPPLEPMIYGQLVRKDVRCINARNPRRPDRAYERPARPVSAVYANSAEYGFTAYFNHIVIGFRER